MTAHDTGEATMTSGDPDRGKADGRQGPGGMRSESDGLTFLSYMLGGMILYGGIGWLIGRWTHVAVLFPIGMLAGLALSVAMIIFRVTRS